jgi:short-subunit dehydrogenase
MAEAAARIWAARGDRLFLLARSDERLRALAGDLERRGAQIAGHSTFEATALDRHADVLDDAVRLLGGLDIALIAHGTATDQPRAQLDPAYALSELRTNGVSVINLSAMLAAVLEAQGHGTLAVISSVAGERGRQSNYVYGSAKALVTSFTQGLRNRLQPRGVHVCTIKPGFVATAMTSTLRQGPLFVSADTAGRCIVSAIDRKKDVAYVPGFWAVIMFVIRSIPETIFKRLKL